MEDMLRERIAQLAVVAVGTAVAVVAVLEMVETFRYGKRRLGRAVGDVMSSIDRRDRSELRRSELAYLARRLDGG